MEDQIDCCGHGVRNDGGRNAGILPMTHNEEIESEPLLLTEPHAPTKQSRWVAKPLLAVLLFCAAVILAAVSFFAFRRCSSSTSHSTGIQFASPEIQYFWGAYTPYFPVKPYIPPPSHCQITQVRWFLFSFNSLIIDLWTG